MKPFSRSLTLICVGILIISMASVGINGWNTSDVIQAGEGTLRIGVQNDIQTLNPLNVAEDVWTWNICDYLYDTPTRKDFDTEVLVPYIAVGSANHSTSIDHTAGELDWNDCEVGNFNFTPRCSFIWESLLT